VVASGSKSSIIYITLDKSVLIPKPELRGFGDISLTKPPFKVTSAGWSLEFVHIKIPLCTRGAKDAMNHEPSRKNFSDITG